MLEFLISFVHASDMLKLIFLIGNQISGNIRKLDRNLVASRTRISTLRSYTLPYCLAKNNTLHAPILHIVISRPGDNLSSREVFRTLLLSANDSTWRLLCFHIGLVISVVSCRPGSDGHLIDELTSIE